MLALSFVGQGVVEARDRDPVAIDVLGEGHPVLGVGQQLVEHPDRRPVVVVAHVLAHRAAPMAVGEHVLGPADRLRRDRLDREARGRSRASRRSRRTARRRPPAADPCTSAALGETPRGLGGALHHHVAPNLIVVVAEPVGKAFRCRVQQQPWRLDRVARHRDRPSALVAMRAVPLAHVAHTRRAPPGCVIELDARRPCCSRGSRPHGRARRADESRTGWPSR